MLERTASAFPIDWPDPSDASLDWVRDPAFPDPIPALTGSLLVLLADALGGENTAARYRNARVNTYVYRARVL